MPFQLPNAVQGSVVTRFPPEPSWHLDIGHCKAALMNQLIASQFEVRVPVSSGYEGNNNLLVQCGAAKGCSDNTAA